MGVDGPGSRLGSVAVVEARQGESQWVTGLVFDITQPRGPVVHVVRRCPSKDSSGGKVLYSIKETGLHSSGERNRRIAALPSGNNGDKPKHCPYPVAKSKSKTEGMGQNTAAQLILDKKAHNSKVLHASHDTVEMVELEQRRKLSRRRRSCGTNNNLTTRKQKVGDTARGQDNKLAASIRKPKSPQSRNQSAGITLSQSLFERSTKNGTSRSLAKVLYIVD